MNLELTGIMLYIVAQFLVGVYVSRRIASEADYFLAGRSLGPMLATFSIFATWFGAESCIGSAGAIYANGLAGSRADPFGYTICLWLMGGLFAVRLWKKQLITLGDLFRERYSVTVERLAILLMIPTSLMWSAAQIRAFGQVLSASSNMNVDLAITIAAGLVIAYTVTGGLMADVMTDFVQGICLIIGLLVLFAVLVSQGGGFMPLWNKIDPARLNFVPAEGGSALSQLEAWMIPIGGSLVAQELISRILASRSPAVARNSTLMAGGIYLAVGFIPVFLGLIAPSFVPSLAEHEQILPTLARTYLHGLLYVLFAGALVSAILSTVDSTLLAVSSLTAHNLMVPFLKDASEKKKLLTARAVVVVAGVASYVMAFYAEGIYELVESASSFGSSGILTIMVFGLFGNFGGKWSAIASLIVGVATLMVGENVFGIETPYLASLAGSFGAYVAVEMVLRTRTAFNQLRKPLAALDRE